MVFYIEPHHSQANSHFFFRHEFTNECQYMYILYSLSAGRLERRANNANVVGSTPTLASMFLWFWDSPELLDTIFYTFCLKKKYSTKKLRKLCLRVYDKRFKTFKDFKFHNSIM